MEKLVLSKSFTKIIMLSIIIFLLALNGVTAEAKTIDLTIAHGGTTASNYHTVCIEYGKKLEELTGGRVKVTVYPGGSLATHVTAFQATIKGISDITPVAIDFWPTENTSSIINLHLMGWTGGAEQLAKIWSDLHEMVPEMMETFKDVKLLWMAANPLMSLHFTKKSVRVPSDIKGMKITSAAPEVLVSLGASAISLPPPEIYTGLERGICEGLNAPYSFLESFKFLPLVPYHTKVDCGSNAFVFIMNRNTWNSLSPDIQKVIDGLSLWGARRFCDTAEQLEAKGIEKAHSLGHTFIEPTAQETKIWLERAKPGHEKWIERMEAKGLPGRKVYTAAKQLIEKYSR